MFITKKRFEREIRRKVKAAIKQHDLEESCRVQEKKMKKLKKQVESLETTVDILFRRMNRMNESIKKEGSVKGFYEGQDGNITIFKGAGPAIPCCVESIESTEPKG